MSSQERMTELAREQAGAIDPRKIVFGMHLKLVSMSDDPDPVPFGTSGMVESVCEVGSGATSWWQVWVRWENGRKLALSLPPDLVYFSAIARDQQGRLFVTFCECGRQVRGCQDPACVGVYHPLDEDHQCPFLVEGFDIKIEHTRRHYLSP
jgi:Domain of unknown function (DUF4314)